MTVDNPPASSLAAAAAVTTITSDATITLDSTLQMLQKVTMWTIWPKETGCTQLLKQIIRDEHY